MVASTSSESSFIHASTCPMVMDAAMMTMTAATEIRTTAATALTIFLWFFAFSPAFSGSMRMLPALEASLMRLYASIVDASSFRLNAAYFSFPLSV